MLLCYRIAAILHWFLTAPARTASGVLVVGGGGAMMDFKGRTVVVTGAAGGVGSALVDVLSASGARVVACDREGTDLSRKEIAQAHHFDLLDDAAIAEFARQVTGEVAPAALVSNAGWTRAETLSSVSTAALDMEMNVNFRSAALLTQAFLPAMRHQAGGAACVFVSSVNAFTHCGNPAYSAAKAALNAWMRAIATEEGRNGVRANVVVPGSIRTGAWDHRIAQEPDILASVSRLYPLGRLVEPEEVARAAVFLASPLASGITGAALNVDAGLLAGNLPFLDLIS
jgi:NAD(P)-dependent dehydrogenase (short-subunit alcohol dehydrogenase family)